MTIEEAIDGLESLKNEEEKRLSPDVYIINRLSCIIEDLTLFSASPQGGGKDYLIRQEIAEKIEGKTSLVTRLAPVSMDHAWVNTLYLAFLTMFRREQCEQYYKDNEKKIKHYIDGETFSKWLAIISAGFIILSSIVAMLLYKFLGIGANGVGEFDYDKVGFTIDLFVQIIAIVFCAAAWAWNRLVKKKYYKTFSYSREELLAIKYNMEGKADKTGTLSPFAVRDCSLPCLETGSAYATNGSIADTSFSHTGDNVASYTEPQYAECPRCGTKLTKCPRCGLDLSERS